MDIVIGTVVITITSIVVAIVIGTSASFAGCSAAVSGSQLCLPLGAKPLGARLEGPVHRIVRRRRLLRRRLRSQRRRRDSGCEGIRRWLALEAVVSTAVGRRGGGGAASAASAAAALAAVARNIIARGFAGCSCACSRAAPSHRRQQASLTRFIPRVVVGASSGLWGRDALTTRRRSGTCVAMACGRCRYRYLSSCSCSCSWDAVGERLHRGRRHPRQRTGGRCDTSAQSSSGTGDGV
mmetsp:Transcript_9816/g.38217  ORF Transcript_9816/g.38217 Transcript_9816/m.38217 type:complete len:238 (+) Transcript_9816:784-1497(+)